MPNDEDDFRELHRLFEFRLDLLRNIYQIPSDLRVPDAYDVLNSRKVNDQAKCDPLIPGSCNLQALNQRFKAAYDIVNKPAHQNKAPEFCSNMQTALERARNILSEPQKENSYAKWAGKIVEKVEHKSKSKEQQKNERTNQQRPKPKQDPETIQKAEEIAEQRAREAVENTRITSPPKRSSFWNNLKNLMNTVTCTVGAHKGEWFYGTANICLQVQICEQCGTKSTRDAHLWSSWQYEASDSCTQIRECKRCSEFEEIVKHKWGDWKYQDADTCVQIQVCERCDEESSETRTVHQWGTWKQSQTEQVRICHRCHLDESQEIDELVTSNRLHNPSGQVPLNLSATLSLQGVWAAGDGLPIHVQQFGNRIRFQGINHFGVVVVQGEGTLQGNQVQMNFQYFDGVVYDSARTMMQISANGRILEGMVQYSVSGVSRPMRLIRQA